jgi:hypothetical protein
MPGSQLFGLFNKAEFAFNHRRTHLISAMSDDHNDLRGLQRTAGVDHVAQDRFTGEFVYHLGPR